MKRYGKAGSTSIRSTPGAGHGQALSVEYRRQVGALGKLLAAGSGAEGAVGAVNFLRTQGLNW